MWKNFIKKMRAKIMMIVNKIWKSLTNELREIKNLFGKYKLGVMLFLAGLVAEIYVIMNFNMSEIIGIGTIAVWVVCSGAIVKWLILGKQ